MPLRVTDPSMLARAVWRRPPRLRGSRLVLVDGRAGAGKTTVAAELTRRLRRSGSVVVVAMDDVYEGWDGLATAGRRLRDQLVGPLRDGRRPRLAGWDWHTSARRAAEPLPLADVWLVEGVGSWSWLVQPWVSLLVWVEAPAELRRRRALDRDGAAFAPHWHRWAAAEQALLVREATRAHADVVWPASGSGG